MTVTCRSPHQLSFFAHVESNSNHSKDNKDNYGNQHTHNGADCVAVVVIAVTSAHNVVYVKKRGERKGKTGERRRGEEKRRGGGGIVTKIQLQRE